MTHHHAHQSMHGSSLQMHVRLFTRLHPQVYLKCHCAQAAEHLQIWSSSHQFNSLFIELKIFYSVNKDLFHRTS